MFKSEAEKEKSYSETQNIFSKNNLGHLLLLNLYQEFIMEWNSTELIFFFLWRHSISELGLSVVLEPDCILPKSQRGMAAWAAAKEFPKAPKTRIRSKCDLL